MAKFEFDMLRKGEAFHFIKLDSNIIKKGNNTPIHLCYTFCVRGSIKFTLNNDIKTVYTISKNTWYFIRPCDIIGVLWYSDDVVLYTLTLNYKLYLNATEGIDLRQFYLDDEAKRFVKLSNKEFLNFISFVRYHKNIIKRMSSQSDKERVMGNCLSTMSLIYSPANLSSEGQNRKGQKVVEQFIRMVNKNFKEQHQLGYYAERLMITSNRLFVLCNEHINMAPKKLIELRLLTHLLADLRDNESRLTELVKVYHFPDLSYMSRYVKKATGESPVEYRKRAVKYAKDRIL